MSDDPKVTKLPTGYEPDPLPPIDIADLQVLLLQMSEEILGLSRAVNGLTKLIARMIKGQGQR